MSPKLVLSCVVLLLVGSVVQSKSTMERGSDRAGRDHLNSFPREPVGDRYSEVDKSGCGSRGGCYKGKCWAGCEATFVPGEWCYTTRGHSQNFKYVECSRDSDCDLCWKCAGSCTVG